ncbi:hypothetical protein EDM02_01235 [Candidatus Cardinium hertigii]|jgi:hypothetical protein|uniref:Uncharacterized protein n=1 Tax=Candidatus Cardinium hertigii TaxID=247481 RepID=A0A3N2QDA3_9BACT|nr:hypothetical protein EDM02_01235 [Candidatus Cardinium hertigii]
MTLIFFTFPLAARRPYRSNLLSFFSTFFCIIATFFDQAKKVALKQVVFLKEVVLKKMDKIINY